MAADPQEAVPAGSLDLLSPVTAPARIVAQAVNYRSHAIDSGMNPIGSRRRPPQGLPLPEPARPGTSSARKASPSSDYEVELGLIIGAALPVGTTVTRRHPGPLCGRAGGRQDVSARQIQLTKTQFYEAKSTPRSPGRPVADPQMETHQPGPA